MCKDKTILAEQTSVLIKNTDIRLGCNFKQNQNDSKV